MADISTLLSLQARSRRNALHASIALRAVRAQRAEAERAVQSASIALQRDRHAAGTQR